MKRVAALLFALCAVTLARADVGPPAGKKSVPVTTLVEVKDDFPDYAFFEVSFSSSPGPPPHGGTSVSVALHFPTPGTTLKGTGNRRSGGSLYAVPRAVAEKNASWKNSAANFAKQDPPKAMNISTSDESWVALGQSVKKGEVPGATSIRFGGSEDLPTSDSRTAITETYRVARTPVGVVFVGDSDPPLVAGSDERARSDAAPAVPWALVAAGATTALVLVVGGVWLARRNSRGAP